MTVDELIALAIAAHQAGDPARAVSLCQSVLLADPHHTQAHNLIGVAHHRAGDFDLAIQAYRRSISLHPDNVQAWRNLTQALLAAGLIFDATDAAQKSLALDPHYPDAYRNLAAAFAAAHRWPESIAALQSALLLRPDSPDLAIALAETFWTAGDIAGARNAVQNLLQLHPDHALAHWYRGIFLLTEGNFSAGWPEFAWYRRVKDLSLPTPRTGASWRGQPLHDQPLLLYTDQGFGDSIQFARFIPLIHQQGLRITLACDPALLRLFSHCFPQITCADKNTITHEFPTHCPIPDLPIILNTNESTIPRAVPYLNPPPQLVHHWRRKIPPDSRPKIGLAWSGRQKNHQLRSTTLVALSPLLAVPNCWFCSLQQPRTPAASHANLADYTDNLTDFADTAALIANLDLVIATDSAVAHLAGALGKPTWLLLSHAADWRWMLHRSDSPWYPTMRLFRSTTPGDWATPIAAAASQLHAALLHAASTNGLFNPSVP